METVTFLKCLSDSTRLRITNLLQQQGELCVCELMTSLQESQPKVSRHLAQLRNCGLLKDERRGQWVYYRINPTLPTWATDILNACSQGERNQLISDQQNLLNEQTDDPCGQQITL
ncbi:metalloregulator ArsR/SmtB family transcription factor [Nitrincola sp. A-D6]|uniref:metalloregulator ArsR/SmtB family transcription factor n=1 Tax=Nitrincola sp. A-D6 TaxID=1545442 RepID=UPI00068C4F65|nr:metalloregulator ArsR/SmtB family transcription factor [Nitrincola sp. A-D6]